MYTLENYSNLLNGRDGPAAQDHGRDWLELASQYEQSAANRMWEHGLLQPHEVKQRLLDPRGYGIASYPVVAVSSLPPNIDEYPASSKSPLTRFL